MKSNTKTLIKCTSEPIKIENDRRIRHIRINKRKINSIISKKKKKKKIDEIIAIVLYHYFMLDNKC